MYLQVEKLQIKIKLNIYCIYSNYSKVAILGFFIISWHNDGNGKLYNI